MGGCSSKQIRLVVTPSQQESRSYQVQNVSCEESVYLRFKVCSFYIFQDLIGNLATFSFLSYSVVHCGRGSPLPLLTNVRTYALVLPTLHFATQFFDFCFPFFTQLFIVVLLSLLLLDSVFFWLNVLPFEKSYSAVIVEGY